MLNTELKYANVNDMANLFLFGFFAFCFFSMTMLLQLGVWCKAHTKSYRVETCDIRLPCMVARFLDFITLSWQRRPFSLSNDGRNVWATVLFLSTIMHRKVIHVIFFFFVFFFCRICRTTVCWDPEILLPWQRDVTTSFY